jgi:hypothetical protein
MASDQRDWTKPVKYDYGTTIRVSRSAPSEARPRANASVCGIRVLGAEQEILGRTEQAGTVLYLVEFGDGVSLEVPEHLLEPVDTSHHP